VINGKKIVDDVSFDVKSGDMISIIGPNGSGKSTLIRLISGELIPTNGKVFFQDKLINDWNSDELSRNRSVLSQSSSISFPFSVMDIAKMGVYPYNLKSNKIGYDESIINDILRVFDLRDYIDRNYMTLSGGEKQRVQLARVLIQVCCNSDYENKLLMLDEPTSFLDIKYQSILFNFLKDLNNQKLTIMMVLHDINHAIFKSNKIIMLKNGSVFSYDLTKPSISVKLFNSLFDSQFKIVGTKDSSEILVTLA